MYIQCLNASASAASTERERVCKSLLAELDAGEGHAWVAVTSPPSFLLPCVSPNLTAVLFHSLMDAPGPTIAHYSLILLSLRSHSRQGQIYFTVVHLSHSAR